MKTAGSDPLSSRIDLGGDLVDGRVVEVDGRAFGGEQGLVLAYQRVLRFGRDADEVVAAGAGVAALAATKRPERASLRFWPASSMFCGVMTSKKTPGICVWSGLISTI